MCYKWTHETVFEWKNMVKRPYTVIYVLSIDWLKIKEMFACEQNESFNSMEKFHACLFSFLWQWNKIQRYILRESS